MKHAESMTSPRTVTCCAAKDGIETAIAQTINATDK
jgi:hypothetical protein